MSEEAELNSRAECVVTAFSELSRIVYPLALQIAYVYRDEHMFPAARAEPTNRILLAAKAVGRVSAFPVLQHPEPPFIVRDLGPETLREQLWNCKPAPPGLLLDWTQVETLAVAVRRVSPAPELRFRNLKNPVLPLEDDWFAGPVGEQGWERDPPARIALESDDPSITLRTSMHWPPWSDPESPEGRLWNQALDALVARGWTEL